MVFNVNQLQFVRKMILVLQQMQIQGTGALPTTATMLHLYIHLRTQVS